MNGRDLAEAHEVAKLQRGLHRGGVAVPRLGRQPASSPRDEFGETGGIPASPMVGGHWKGNAIDVRPTVGTMEAACRMIARFHDALGDAARSIGRFGVNASRTFPGVDEVEFDFPEPPALDPFMAIRCEVASTRRELIR